MIKTYYRKENKFIWYFIILLCVGLLIFGYVLINYVAWQVLPAIAMGVGKIIRIHKEPEIATISLNDEGITLLNDTENPPFYEYTNISAIKLNSKALNGHLKLKKTNKKIVINSVALDLKDQQEITAFVNTKLK